MKNTLSTIPALYIIFLVRHILKIFEDVYRKVGEYPIPEGGDESNHNILIII